MKAQNTLVRVRFAPSPTGYLHIGNARTALFNYLFARHHGGKFVLRIEDTDIERSEAKYEDQILADLKWLGLAWDEGPDSPGAFGPYRQSDRLDIYKTKLEVLKAKHLAYECFCSEEELESRRQEALAAGKIPRYDNRCRNLTEQQKHEFVASGRKPVIRFKVPDAKIIVKDLIRGDVEFDSVVIGDFVIVKSDGGPSFHFAVVADDIDMKISHVIRGEDHLSNTPRHVLLFEALGAPLPKFAHMSMTLGPDGSRLSKRHGATSVEQYRQAGYLADALVNYLALLGWSPGDNKEVMSRDEMIKLFSLDRMTKSAAIFDKDKLDWMNRTYIRPLPLEVFAQSSAPFLEGSGLDVKAKDQTWIHGFLDAIRGYLNCLAEIPKYVQMFVHDTIEIDPQALEYLKSDNAKIVLEKFSLNSEGQSGNDAKAFLAVMKKIQSETGIKGKELYMPLRIALTGKSEGLELQAAVPLLSALQIGKRVEFAKNLAGGKAGEKIQ